MTDIKIGDLVQMVDYPKIIYKNKIGVVVRFSNYDNLIIEWKDRNLNLDPGGWNPGRFKKVLLDPDKICKKHEV